MSASTKKHQNVKTVEPGVQYIRKLKRVPSRALLRAMTRNQLSTRKKVPGRAVEVVRRNVGVGALYHCAW